MRYNANMTKMVNNSAYGIKWNVKIKFVRMPLKQYKQMSNANNLSQIVH